MNSEGEMKGRFLLDSGVSFVEANIYADKSALVIDWLLRVGINKKTFSLREVAKDRKVSVGLVQRVFAALVFHGLLKTEGVRTVKKFSLKKPELLLKNWLQQYSVVKKCKMWTYRSAFSSKEEMLRVLKKEGLAEEIALALHSAAEAHGCKNTNLQSLELYLLKPGVRLKIEKVLELQPQERGYEVLLVEPYYKALLRSDIKYENIRVSSPLLTFLDLYHFPLRGHEQAEFMADRIKEIKRIYRKG